MSETLTDTTSEAAKAGMAFTFGDPVPVLDGRGLLDYVECWQNGRWYEPPISLEGLARSTGSSVYLKSGLKFKSNALVSTFQPHRLLSRAQFQQFAADFCWCGNAYLEAKRNALGRLTRLEAPLAKYMRVGVEAGSFYQVTGWNAEHEFERGSVGHVREVDINQEIYGMPDWLAALQSALLNESATLFRRKYYQNGSHAGFILYLHDAIQDESMVNDLREAMKKSKGPGNFRNLFVYAPGGKKDGMQLIPISEVAAKDDFGAIKNISRDDQLAALRIPPQLMGVVPQNAGGFGSIKDAATVWAMNELRPMQETLQQINEWLGEEVISFKPYEVPAGE